MAQADYFLKIDDVDGESIVAGHEKWIELSSWSWGETNVVSSDPAGGSTGKVSVQDFSFTLHRSAASPLLFLACATGQHYDKAQLECRKAGSAAQKQEVYLNITLSDVLVSSYGLSGHEPGAIVRDELSLNFTKIEWTFTAKNGNPIKAGYDVKANKKV